MKRLYTDEHGAMMIIGVVSAAFLIGAVWFIWGVGQAAVFRENMQAGADAAAYQTSVYDARGMNIIVMINLIMSVVLTVLVVMRLVQVIVLAVNIISCIFFWTGVGAAVCAATTSAEAPLSRAVDRVAVVVNKVLTVLSLTESGTALLWPTFASGMSVTVSSAYKPDVTGTISIGTSNVPLQGAADLASQVGLSFFDFSAEKPVSVDNFKAAFNVSQNGLFCNYGGKFMLPVQSDDYANLCARAGANIVYSFTGLISIIPVVGAVAAPVTEFFDKFVGGALASLTRKFSPFFCQDDAAAIQSLVDKLLNMSGNEESTEGNLKAKCDKKRKEAKGGDSEAQYQACIKALERTKKLGNTTGNKRFGWNETCSKTLYADATMLDQNFQNWGFSFGSYADKSARTVGAATVIKGGGGVAAASGGANLQVAQSEFYYEPKTAGESSDQETSEPGITGTLGLDNYMWNMRWRARLRRVRAPQIGLGSGAAGFITKFAQGLGGKAVDAKLGGRGGEIVNQGIGGIGDFLLAPLKNQPPVVIGGNLVKPEMVH